jgi:hypothetical protein
MGISINCPFLLPCLCMSAQSSQSKVYTIQGTPKMTKNEAPDDASRLLIGEPKIKNAKPDWLHWLVRCHH